MVDGSIVAAPFDRCGFLRYCCGFLEYFYGTAVDFRGIAVDFRGIAVDFRGIAVDLFGIAVNFRGIAGYANLVVRFRHVRHVCMTQTNNKVCIT